MGNRGTRSQKDIEAALDFDREAAFIVSADGHAAHQIADPRGCFFVAQFDRAAERFGELRDLLLKPGEGLRVQRYNVDRLGRVGELGADLALLLHKLLGAAIETVDVANPLDEPIGDPVGFLSNRPEAALEIRTARDRIGGKPLPLSVIFACIFGEKRRVAQLSAQLAENLALDGIEIESGWIGAVAAFLVAGALNARAACLVDALARHAGAARSAAQQARERPARLALQPRARTAALLDAIAHLLPKIGVDDRQFGGFRFRENARLVAAGDALAGVRVSHHTEAVPHQNAGVNLVMEYPDASGPGASDGRRVPFAAGGRGNSIAIETFDNLSCCGAGDILLADPANDRGLLLHDLTLAGLAWDCGVAIGYAAGRQPRLGAPFLAAADLVCVVFPEELPHQPAQTDQHRVDRAFMDRADLDALES